jgi:hypothetical protein
MTAQSTTSTGSLSPVHSRHVSVIAPWAPVRDRVEQLLALDRLRVAERLQDEFAVVDGRLPPEQPQPRPSRARPMRPHNGRRTP